MDGRRPEAWMDGARPMNGVLQEAIIDAVELPNPARRGRCTGRASPFGVLGKALADCALALDRRLKAGMFHATSASMASEMAASRASSSPEPRQQREWCRCAFMLSSGRGSGTSRWRRRGH